MLAFGSGGITDPSIAPAPNVDDHASGRRRVCDAHAPQPSGVQERYPTSGGRM
jgi:hypothetical protein